MDPDIKRLLSTVPEKYTDDGKDDRIRIALDRDNAIDVPRPTPALKKWLSGKSRDVTDKFVASRTSIPEVRIHTFRIGVLPTSWECARLASLFAYDEGKLLLLLFIHARKRLTDRLQSLTMQVYGSSERFVLAIVPEVSAVKAGYPIFKLETGASVPQWLKHKANFDAMDRT